MKIIRVSLLVIALAGAVYAGEMPCGVASPSNMPSGGTAPGQFARPALALEMLTT